VPQTLLLADDSVTIQRVIELTFADEDIDVVAVSDGEQAIARLDTVPPDIVLVDVGMPGKTGYEVAAYVKRSPQLSHIPVVLLTGAFEAIDPAKAAGAGCDGVLAKPFEPQHVIGRVKELLNKPQRPIGSQESIFGASSGTEPESGAKSIDDYFDQLDEAFSNLAGRSAPVAEARVPVSLDWFGLKPAGSTPDLDIPASHESGALWGRTHEAVPSPAVPPSAPMAPSAAPVPVAAPVAADLVIMDDLVDRVSKRVLAQLTDAAVRETVTTIAERLIRDEIDRIKASIE
jgi:CheY-like chemotaxis protein